MQKRFSFPPLPRTALALAAAAALALSGCAGSSGSGTPAESYAVPGRLVLLPMHRPTLPANRRVLMRFWHTSFKKACRTIRSPFIFLSGIRKITVSPNRR